MSNHGYAGKILIVDLSSRRISTLSTSDYAPRFLGGRGISARLYWELVPPETGSLEADNCIICATGPITGFNGIAGSRWTICSRSPVGQPEAFTHGNLGGRWGSELKYSGYDALAVTGRSEKPVYIYIHDGKVEIREADFLWRRTTFDCQHELRQILGQRTNILTIGPAAEKMVSFATAMAEKGASVSAGLGAVFGSKNLKAIAVKGDTRPTAAHPEVLKKIIDYIRPIRAGSFDAPSPWAVTGLTRKDPCYNCGLGCSRQSYSDGSGHYKSFCQAGVFYAGAAAKYYHGWNIAQLKATQLCDAYGLDTMVMQPMIGFLEDCYREGLVSESETGLPLSKIGSLEFIESLVMQIARREGLGDILADGCLKAAEKLGNNALSIAQKHLATRAGESGDYDPRLIMNSALLYATEIRRPIQQLHAIAGNLLISWSSWAQDQPGAFFSTADLLEVARRFWGSTQAADYSTWEGKALCSKTVQDRAYAQESLVLCDVHWPMMITSANHPNGHVGDPSLESRILNAVTGEKKEPADLLRTGERIFNLQRAILLRQGWRGRQDDRLMDSFYTEPLKKGEVFFNPEGIMPGAQGKLISRLGSIIERESFEKLKSEYYFLRGWDEKIGFPTRARLSELDMADVAADLNRRGLISC